MKRMPIDGAEGRRRFTAGTVLLCAALLAQLCAGCSTMDAAALRQPLDDEAISGIAGPVERRLRAADWQRRREQLTSGGAAYEGLAELDAAQELFDAGEYRAAETAFKDLARNRENRGKNWQTRVGEIFSSDKSSTGTLFGQYGDPIHEDALFMTAECQFARKKYPWAQDSYAALLDKYPSSRHLDDVTQRLFFIARNWLRVPERGDDPDNEIQLVSHESDGETTVAIDEVRGAAGWPLLPNVFDRTRPVFDTEGRAIQALETIWQHDATGPLADDALMLQATYAQRRGDFIEAARLYQLVRDEYPGSSHFEDAFLLGSHVTLASYSGANYDGKSLETARDLKEVARTFPNLSPEQRERLGRELDALREAEMEREWALVEFYLRKNQPASVAVHCNRILHRYPESEFARRAWNVLQEQEMEMNGQRRFRLWPFVDEDEDEGTDSSTPPLVADQTPAPIDRPGSTAATAPEDNNAESGGVFRRFFLRPVERHPQLVEPPPEAVESDNPAHVQL